MKTRSIRKRILQTSLVALMLLICIESTAQEKRPLFLGIQPGYTKEKFYEKNELDINILPVVLEFPLAKRINLRFTSILNYHLGDNNQISDIGIHTVAPIFFRKNENVKMRNHGFYIGPVLGLGQNIMNDHFTTTLAVEPGYLFEANKQFTLSIGIQYGGSYFDYKNKNSEWVEHFGIKINLGFWL